MAGLDYTFTSWLYVNFMYLRGFLDEFNDVYGLHNYVVGNIDLKFLDNELMFRLFRCLGGGRGRQGRRLQRRVYAQRDVGSPYPRWSWWPVP